MSQLGLPHVAFILRLSRNGGKMPIRRYRLSNPCRQKRVSLSHWFQQKVLNWCLWLWLNCLDHSLYELPLNLSLWPGHMLLPTFMYQPLALEEGSTPSEPQASTESMKENGSFKEDIFISTQGNGCWVWINHRCPLYLPWHARRRVAILSYHFEEILSSSSKWPPYNELIFSESKHEWAEKH